MIQVQDTPLEKPQDAGALLRPCGDHLFIIMPRPPIIC